MISNGKEGKSVSSYVWYLPFVCMVAAWLLVLTIWLTNQNTKVNETAAVTTQLDKCVTNLEKVHLIAKDGTIFHATLETSSTATNDHMARTPVLSE